MQLGPSLSPDGTQAVFFSERDRLSLDLFLADVATGRVIRKLATTAASAKFDSLQPLRSAGAWSPDGQWFAFAAVRQGKAALMLIDMTGRGRDREIVFDGIGQVLSPSWSPDGRSIVFSALAGGLTDLYMCDLATGQLRQLTDDAFADLQPAWSHDGRTIAFVSERFSSDLDALRFGRPRLALMDVDTLTVRDTRLRRRQCATQPAMVRGRSRSLFRRRSRRDDEHLSGREWIRARCAGSRTSTPASAASRRPARCFRWRTAHLRWPSPSTNAAARAWWCSTSVRRSTASRLPMRLTTTATALSRRAEGAVDAYLADSTTGLPEPASMSSHAYNSKISLEGVGQPYLSSGGGPFGTFVRAGGALFFGDMLGERRVGAAVQVGNHLRDAAFMFRFLNQERRWNWGALAELAPSVVRYRRTEAIEYEGQSSFLKQADYLQRMQLRAAAVVAYPFSKGLRVEFTGGVRHATYHRDLRSQISSDATGKVLFTRSRRIARRVADDGGGGQRGADPRHHRVWSDGTAPGIAVPARGRARGGAAVLHERDRGLPSVSDARSSVLDRRPRAAFGPLWRRRQRSAPAVELPRIELLRSRAPAGSPLLPSGCDARVRRRSAGQPIARRQRRSARAVVGHHVAANRLRIVPGRPVCVRRRRPHLGRGELGDDQQLRRRHPHERRWASRSSWLRSAPSTARDRDGSSISDFASGSDY